MPLPVSTPSTPWPPPDIAPYVRDQAAWHAWWSGDTDKLAATTDGGGTTNRRRFWARQRPSTGQPVKATAQLHATLAADIASTSADLLFGEPPALLVPDVGLARAHERRTDGAELAPWPADAGLTAADTVAAQDRLDTLVDTLGLANRMLEAAEVCAATGGVYLRPMWDQNAFDHPLLTVVDADRGVPDFRYGQLVAVTFVEELHSEMNGSIVWRHLERHEPGVILHGLYVGSGSTLGRQVSLGDHPATKNMLDVVEVPVEVTGGRPGIMPRFVPNVLPNRKHRRYPIGRSDFAGCEPFLDALDETWCADEETEILTANGWVRYEALHEGDSVLTLNHSTGLSEWQPVQEVCVFPAQPREMVSIESRSHSSLTTPNHRWPVERPHYRGGEHKAVSGFDRAWATSESFLADDRVPLAAECADLPDEAKYTDALVEAVAWFWTEGHIRKLRDGRPGRSVVITQSPTANPHLCERIRGALTRLFGPAVDAFPRFGKALGDGTPRWREGANGKRWEFVLNSDAGEIVQHLAPGRVPTHEFLFSLTKAQLELFIETSMLADNSGEHSLAQKDCAAAEAFQFACILSGRATSVTKRDYRPRGNREYDMTNVRMRSQRHFWPGRPGVREKVMYDGEVWCPRTANQTWLARRNGKVYFTGNTSWMRDLRLGQARLVVPDEFLSVAGAGPGAGKRLDLDAELFTGLSIAEIEKLNDPIRQVQFDIRVEQHERTTVALTEHIISTAGYSPQTFGLRIEGRAESGTALRIREGKTLKTQNRKQRYWQPELSAVCETLLALDRVMFGRPTPVVRPAVGWQELADDPIGTAQWINLLSQAQAASIETRVRLAQPELEDDQVAQEVERVRAESGMGLPDPVPGLEIA